jgi:hypothetical protein
MSGIFSCCLDILDTLLEGVIRAGLGIQNRKNAMEDK